MRVSIAFRNPQWPSTCPCCGAKANSRLRLQRSKGVFLLVAAAETVLRLDVPYCETCVSHARSFEKGTFGGMLLPTTAVLFVAFFVGIIALALSGGGSAAFEMTMMLVMPAVAAALFIVYRAVRRTNAGVDRGHASTAPVLKIQSWSQDAVVLECANASYALLLRQSNPHSSQSGAAPT
jgi:hypothetical protein